MVCHPAESVNTRVAPINYVSDDVVEDLTIPSGAEQGFAMITAQDHMVTTARDMQSRWSGHPCHSERKLTIDYVSETRLLSSQNSAKWQKWQARHQTFEL
jgi:hypothetical protein